MRRSGGQRGPVSGRPRALRQPTGRAGDREGSERTQIRARGRWQEGLPPEEEASGVRGVGNPELRGAVAPCTGSPSLCPSRYLPLSALWPPT